MTVNYGYNEADADCHYGDHFWKGAYCSNCGEEDFFQLYWLKIEKAKRENRWHGDHFHLTVEAAKECEAKCAAAKYWYYIIEDDCPVCMRTSTERERRPGPKPIMWEDRHEYTETWDGCGL